MMRKIIFLLFAIVQLSNSYSQNIEGLYHTAYWEAIGQKDTTYSQTMFYADFIDSKHFLYSLLLNDFRDTLEYWIKDSIVNMNLGKIVLTGKLETNRINVVLQDYSSKVNHVYEKLKKPINNTDNNLTSDFFKDKTFSINNEYGFDFIVNNDNSFIYTEGTNNKYFGSTNTGRWDYYEYKEHYFMRYEELFGDHIFHLVEKNANNLIMETRDFRDKHSFPKKELVKFKWKPKLTSSEIENIENKLLGIWQGDKMYGWDESSDSIYLVDISFFGEMEIEYDKLIKPNLKLTFNKDKSFKFVQEATIIKNGKKTFNSRNIEGIWKVGSNGLFIQLNTNKDILFLTIKELDDNAAVFITRIYVFNPSFVYIVEPVKYKKVTN